MSVSTKSEVQIALDPWKLIHLLALHLRLIVLCTVAGAVAAFFYALNKPSIYVSQAVLEVAEESGPNLDFERREASDLNSAALLKTIEQTIASQGVLKTVIATQKLAEDPYFAPPKDTPYTEAELISLLQQRVYVSLIRGTRLIVVNVRDGDPLKAQRLAQSVIEGFFAQRLDLRREGATSARTFLLAEAKRLESEVHAAEERLQDYQEKHKAVSLTDRHNIVTQRLTDLGQQVTVARGQRLALETAQSNVLGLIKDRPRDLLNLREVASLPEIIELRRLFHEQTAQVSTLALRYRAKHPSMIQATRQLGQTQENLDAALVNAGNALIQSYRTAKANEEVLDRELRQQQDLAMELSRLAISYRALEREAHSSNALYEQVLARLKTSDLSQSLVAVSGLGRNPIQVVEQPMVPVYPSGVSSKFILLGGLVAGAFVGVLIVLIRRALDPSLHSIDDAESYLGAPSLAAVPRSTLPAGDFVIHSHPATIEAESFRSLRTSLSLMFPDDAHKVVMFTSAIPGEGKSYCSANYSAALAQQGFRTLLIDADLRRPVLRARHALPGSTGPGLTDCLRVPVLLPDAIHPTRMKNLFVAGDLQGSVKGAELLAGPDFKNILASATQVFDRVVIDTAPLAAVGDPAAIAPHAGAICLVIHAGRTPRRVIRRACILLGRPPTGLVLNQIKPGRSARYDYYSHGETYAQEPVAPAPTAKPAPLSAIVPHLPSKKSGTTTHAS